MPLLDDSPSTFLCGVVALCRFIVVVDVVGDGALVEAVVVVVVGGGYHDTADLEGAGGSSGVDDVITGLAVATSVVVVTICKTVPVTTK